MSASRTSSLLRADRVFRRGDAVALHELLGEALAGFQLRGGSGRAEDRPATPLEFVHHAQGQRQLRTDHGDIGTEPAGKLHQRIQALQVGGDALGVGGNAAVPGSAVKLLDARRLPQLPYHRVFATTATEDEDLHGINFHTTLLATTIRREAKEKSRGAARWMSNLPGQLGDRNIAEPGAFSCFHWRKTATLGARLQPRRYACVGSWASALRELALRATTKSLSG